MTFSIKDTDDFTKSQYWSLSTTVQGVLKCWYHFLSLARNFIVLGIKFFVERRPELIGDDQNPHTPSERDAKILVQGLHVYTLTLRSLTLYIYGAPILDVSRSHTTTQHSR